MRFALPFRINPRRAIIITHDIVMTPVAVLLAYLLRLGADGLAAWGSSAFWIALGLTPVAAAVYWLFGLYRGVWRFASIPDVINITKAVTALAAILAIIDFFSGGVIVPRTVPPIYWLVQILLLAGPRFLYRLYRDRRLQRRSDQDGYRIPVIVAGTGEEAEQLIRRLELGASEPMRAVGLVTHKPHHLGERLRNVPVLGLYTDLDRVVETLRRKGITPRRLIFTREALDRTAMMEDVLGAARRLGLTTVHPVGSLEDVGEAQDKTLRLAPVAIEDLLGRSAREIDLAPIRTLVGGRRVLVTGGGGSIGSELCRQVAAMGPARLIIVESSEHALYAVHKELAREYPDVLLSARLGDVRDAAGVRRIFADAEPDLVFHAAALKHVNITEAHPLDAAMTNALGTKHVADAALAVGARAMVFISTDKAVSPVSVLGATKRAGELYVAALDRESRALKRPTRFLSVRFGNVLGSSGSVVPLFREQLERGGPITVTDPEAERYFMTVSEAVTLVLMATALGAQEGVEASTFVLDMGRPVKIVDLAKQMIRLAGYEPGRDIPIVFTGLRPGERLKESLENEREALRKTAVEGVLVADVAPLNLDRLRRGMDELRAGIAAWNEETVFQAIETLVPDYHSPRASLPSVAE